MQLTLVIGNRNYSSWSMRAWLLLRWLGCEFEEVRIPLYRDDSRAALAPYSPSGKLPALIDHGIKIWDSLAIAIHMADRYPQVWPTVPEKRAFVRSICAEMHSGFMALRSAMPHNARGRNRRVEITPEVQQDVDRVEAIWIEGITRFGADGPWLAGEFGIADIIFAPVASRFRTYGVSLRAPADAYCAAILQHPLCEQWFAEGADEAEVIAGGEVGG